MSTTVSALFENPGTTGMQLASAGLQVAGSNAQAASLRGQAQTARFQAEQATIRGKVAASDLRAQVIAALAAQSAMFSASGVTAQGTPETLARGTVATGERLQGSIDARTRMRRGALLMQGSEGEQAARAARDFGNAQVALSLFDYADHLDRRGGQPPPGRRSAPPGVPSRRPWGE
jgi:hypothetical protein